MTNPPGSSAGTLTVAVIVVELTTVRFDNGIEVPFIAAVTTVAGHVSVASAAVVKPLPFTAILKVLPGIQVSGVSGDSESSAGIGQKARFFTATVGETIVPF